MWNFFIAFKILLLTHPLAPLLYTSILKSIIHLKIVKYPARLLWCVKSSKTSQLGTYSIYRTRYVCMVVKVVVFICMT